MSNHAPTYPKRLIEVDLPIARISAHARREKKVRHGQISTLHIWWARRPLAACRAVICAGLWPDPADELCPPQFRTDAFRILHDFKKRVLKGNLSPDQRAAHFFVSQMQLPENEVELVSLRNALLDFIAEFANWDLSTNRFFLDASRLLTQSAHEALGGAIGTRPLVIDPFAGGGAIPLEALRVGADVFASDLNPVAVLLNKVVLEFMPKYGHRLSAEVRKWGEWVKQQAKKELADFYPNDPDGSIPIAYLWARTIRCEGPGCGAEIPLVRSLWLSKKGSQRTALRMHVDLESKSTTFEVVRNCKDSDVGDGTVKKGTATCPVCGYTVTNARVRHQLSQLTGGADYSRLMCVVLEYLNASGRIYRPPNDSDYAAFNRAAIAAKACSAFTVDGISVSPFPDETIPKERPSPNARGLSAVTRIGVVSFGDLFSTRQKLSLHVFARAVQRAAEQIINEEGDSALAAATASCLALVFSKMAGLGSSFNRWEPNVQCVQDIFGRQAIGLVWDYAESNPLGGSRGSFETFLDGAVNLLGVDYGLTNTTTPHQENACAHPLPDEFADCISTDPPYFDSVPYADLSDYFYVWLRRALCTVFPEWRTSETTPKDEEAIWNPGRVTSAGIRKDEAFYTRQIQRAFAEARRVTKSSGIGTVVFAHKSTAGWEAILEALLNAGWVVTASWPIDTELGTRVNAQGTASLASSVHLVCRPREYPDGSLHEAEIGDWRDILSELPSRIHEWMPRLAAEGVVGADAIFACIGPALEIFSRYSHVEKSNGNAVPLREYLEHVWAAVSHEALTMIFKDADAAGLEPDARLTAMWLWTLNTTTLGTDADEAPGEGTESDIDDEEEDGGNPAKTSGFVLEFDTARKIAQGLGIHLDRTPSVVEVKGDKARLLPVAERTKYLFGKDTAEPATTTKKPKKKDTQLTLFAALQEADAAENVERPELKAPAPGSTVLDQVHQSMILFAAGRGEALKRFLVEEGIGKDGRFWKLAQSLSALYPSGIDEKRWVDGVLARKKSLGL